MTWLGRPLYNFPSNLVMSDGSLVGMFGKAGLGKIGSLVNLVKSKIFHKSKYGRFFGPPIMCGGRELVL
jgi:hypothetical protein